MTNESILSYFFRFIITQNVIPKNVTIVNDDFVLSDLTINTTVGQIRGLRPIDGNYTMYTGIPYGKVDKANPFGISSPYPPFTDIFITSTDISLCPQPNVDGTFDCLKLNIYVPDSANSSTLLPVMFWIHGGAFVVGTGHMFIYGPKYLVSHDVILVTINYRLGPYGFMCLNTPEFPGNQGLKDQLLALRWVRDNIAFFGGDKDKITIFGQDAGSISAHLLLLSSTENIFDKVILQSGVAFTAGVIQKANRSVPIDLARKLGYKTTDVNEAMAFLAKTNTTSVIKAATEKDMDPWWPCIDSGGDVQIIRDYPIDLNVPNVQSKSFMIGLTDDEAMAFVNGNGSELLEEFDVYWNYLQVFFTLKDSLLKKLQNIMKTFYVGTREETDTLVFENANYISDVVFTVPTDRTVTSFLNSGAKSIFYYKFSHIGDRNYAMTISNVTLGGALHGDELGYLFDMESFSGLNDEDSDVMNKITTMWTNFAKYGDPTPETTKLLPVKWSPITQNSPRYYMTISQELSVSTNPFHDRIAFWNLFFNAYGQYEIGYRDHNYAVSKHVCYALLFAPVLVLIGSL